MGFYIAGTIVGEGEPLQTAKFRFPLGIVIGSEQKGLRDITKKNIDVKLTNSDVYGYTFF